MYHQPAMKRVPTLFETGERRPGISRDPMVPEAKGAFKSANLQEIFLNNCRKNENRIRVELLRGESRTGRIVGFDSQSVILADELSQYLIYKSAISCVIPEEPVQYIFNEIHRRDEIYDTYGNDLHMRSEKPRNDA